MVFVLCFITFVLFCVFCLRITFWILTILPSYHSNLIAKQQGSKKKTTHVSLGLDHDDLEALDGGKMLYKKDKIK